MCDICILCVKIHTERKCANGNEIESMWCGQCNAQKTTHVCLIIYFSIFQPFTFCNYEWACMFFFLSLLVSIENSLSPAIFALNVRHSNDCCCCCCCCLFNVANTNPTLSGKLIELPGLNEWHVLVVYWFKIFFDRVDDLRK